MQKYVAAILTILIASPALSQNDPGTIELTPYGAYSFGGTFKDEDGRVMVTNGTHMILNKTLLTVHV